MKKGIAASKGYAIGTVFIQEHEEIIISDAKVSDIAAEKEKLSKALAQSKEQLEAIKEKTANDKIFLGGYLFLMYGKEITALIGGMDDEYIDLDVSYSIHFKMLKKAIEYGYRSYNFYEVKDVNDGGFFFKQNFGAKLFEHIGEFDYPIDLNSYKKYKKYFPLYYGVKSVYKNK